MSRHALRRLLAVAVSLGPCACERVGGGYVGPTAAPSTSPTPTAPACTTLPTASVVVGIAPTFSVALAASYGQIAGYADVTVAQPALATVVNAKVGDTLQFANLASDGVTAHSAVGFGGSNAGFPAVPYTFPAAAASPSASQIIGPASWSTGRIAASSSGTPCLSQAFAVPAVGTYYFGDLDFYNTITSFRDVIVVQ